MDDLKSFTYVLAVAECKSISKAAELLYTFTTITQQIYIQSGTGTWNFTFRAEIEWNQSDRGW